MQPRARQADRRSRRRQAMARAAVKPHTVESLEWVERLRHDLRVKLGRVPRDTPWPGIRALVASWEPTPDSVPDAVLEALDLPRRPPPPATD